MITEQGGVCDWHGGPIHVERAGLLIQRLETRYSQSTSLHPEITPICCETMLRYYFVREHYYLCREANRL